MKYRSFITIVLSLLFVGCAKPKAEPTQQTASHSSQSAQGTENSSFVDNFEFNDDIAEFANRFSGLSAEEIVTLLEEQTADLTARIDEFVPKFWDMWNGNNGSIQSLASEFLDSSGQLGQLLSDAREMLLLMDQNGTTDALKDRIVSAIGNLNLSQGTLSIIEAFLKPTQSSSSN